MPISIHVPPITRDRLAEALALLGLDATDVPNHTTIEIAGSVVYAEVYTRPRKAESDGFEDLPASTNRVARHKIAIAVVD